MATGQKKGPGRGEIFDLLSNHRRRYAIHYCKREEGSVTLSDLAEHVAAWEQEKTVQELTSAERKRVYTSLQQTHLPTLDKAGMVEFDNGTVTLTEQAEELDVYLDIVPGGSIPWAEYYLGLSVVSAIVLACAWAGLFPEAIPDLAWAGLVLGAFAISSGVHFAFNRQLALGEVERPP